LARYLWSSPPRLPLILAPLLAVLSLLPSDLLAFIVLLLPVLVPILQPLIVSLPAHASLLFGRLSSLGHCISLSASLPKFLITWLGCSRGFRAKESPMSIHLYPWRCIGSCPVLLRFVSQQKRAGCFADGRFSHQLCQKGPSLLKKSLSEWSVVPKQTKTGAKHLVKRGARPLKRG
jgi:hypothetical protein